MNNSNIKFFTFLLLVGLTFNSCQKDDPIIVEENIPSVTKEWFFQPGQERIENEAENPEVLTQPTVGKNKTWDFSEVTESSMGSYTISFVEPAGLPSANLFPDATVAQLHPNSFVIYYEASNDTLKMLGAHLSTNRYVTFNQPTLIGLDPLNFGESFDFTWEQTQVNTSTGADEFHYISNNEVKFAGTGTVITPARTFEDCIMFEETFYDLQGTLITHSFTFYKDNFSNQVAYYSMNLNPSTDEFDTRFYWSE